MVVKYLDHASSMARNELTKAHYVRSVCRNRGRTDPGARHVVQLIDVVPVYGEEEEEGERQKRTAFAMVMPYLNRGHLMENRERPLLRRNLWTITEQVLDGLRFLHRAHVFHCDIKPQNIMLHDEGQGSPRAVIVDYSLAVFPGERYIGGTPAFMLHRGHASAEQDLFALVLTVYAVLDPDILNAVYRDHPKADWAAEMDARMRSAHPEVVLGESRLASLEEPFRFNLQSYQPQWPNLERGQFRQFV